MEPEFDVNERDSWYALDEYETALCPHCGLLQAICSNPDGLHGDGFYPQRTVCYVTASREMLNRKWRAQHDKAKPDTAGYLPTDGVTIWASPLDLSPDDDFLATGPQPASSSLSSDDANVQSPTAVSAAAKK